ncbi:hypothetical protein EV426DRAFT_413966 [Tirmania nivea]|nr:hypothetical protein EV426DRAFT_413966 [Tirmania nivea]
MDGNIASFISITGASTKNAESYLHVADGDLAQAVQLFFDMGGADMNIPASSDAPAAPAHSQPSGASLNVPIAVNNDDDMMGEDDDDFRVALEASRSGRPNQDNLSPITAGSTRLGEQWDDDEAMARRLQEELYSDTGPQETNGVRAPIARTTETLVGPDEDYLEQMAARARGVRRGGTGRPGTFNPRTPTIPSGGVWDNGPESRRRFAEATSGASELSAKQQSLAEMYRPPYEIIEHLEFDDAREQAKQIKKWILVNIQDRSIFDCQVLNRDIWKAKEVRDTIKEHCIFLQYDKSGIDGQKYVRLYFPHAIDVPPTSPLNPFPIIAIIDPRTGEQVKVWAETPKEPLEFVMQLHEFLERYSLDNSAKNPVQKPNQIARKLDVDHMTEDEMLKEAMMRSLNNGEEIAGVHHDPDELTREQEKDKGKGKQPEEINLIEFDDDAPSSSAPIEKTPFQTISKTNHHVEPPMGSPGITRIQFRLADGSRVVRRFALGDRVSRLYEWIKADLLPEQAAKKGEQVTEATSDKQFELVSMGKNLIDRLDSTLEEAQLKMGTVMIEFVDNE